MFSTVFNSPLGGTGVLREGWYGEDGGVRAPIDFRSGLVSDYRGDFVFISVYMPAERIKYSGDQCFTWYGLLRILIMCV